LSQNSLLQSFPADLRDRLLEDLVQVRLELRHEVAERGAAFKYVYFPLSCLISVVVNFENGSTIEAELVGNNGYSGISVLLGLEASTSDMYVQIA